MTESDHQRVRELFSRAEEPFASSYRKLIKRADAALQKSADPFWMEDITEIRFGWCGASRKKLDTLQQLTKRLERESDWIRSLALAYSLTGEKRYAEKSEELLMEWVGRSELLNLYDLDIKFEGKASFRGMTETGYCGDRPWNMALDTMWQTYGLINVSDTYVLLKEGGYRFSEEAESAALAWIRELAEAVNSSFHAWTRWADHHSNSSSYKRYRSDNHLSWCLAGLLAASVALEDAALADYVLQGGEWEDSKAGRYRNPSSIRSVIDHTIEGGEQSGRIYEEKIRRKPPVGYSFFHLWPMALVASVAEKHYEDDVWSYKGEDGAGLRDAFQRYAGYTLGEWDSPKPEQEGKRASYSWLFEIAASVWPDAESFQQAVESGPREKFLVQSIGPVTLLYGRPD